MVITERALGQDFLPPSDLDIYRRDIVTALDTFKPPQSYDEALSAVMQIPGISEYDGLDEMTVEVLKQLDAEGMIPLIANGLAWSADETEAFFTHPDRQPFRSKIDFSPHVSERVKQLLSIGNWLRFEYDRAQPDLKKSAGETLVNFYEFSLVPLFAPLDYEYRDWLRGIDPADRLKGTIKPTASVLKVLEEAAHTVAQEGEHIPEDLLSAALTATEGGNLDLISTFLFNNRGAHEVREVLRQVAVIRSKDAEIQLRKLRALWLVERYSNAMRMNLEMTYTLAGLPSGDTIEARIGEFLNRPDLVDEFRRHLMKEAGSAVQAAEQTGQIPDIYSILEARAEHHGFPDSVATLAELEERTKKVFAFLTTILPMATSESTRSFLETPTRMGTATRQSNTTYQNREDELINVVLLDPRQREVDFAEVAGHEGAHKAQAIMLTLAAAAGYIPKGSNERLPEPIKEEFSQLVEHAAGIVWRSQMEATTPTPEESPEGDEPAPITSEWTNFLAALGKRFQGPISVMQRQVRLRMEQLMHDGVTEPTDKQLTHIVDELTPKLHELFTQGVAISLPAATVGGNVSILSRKDGVVYLAKYLTDPIAPSESSQRDLHIDSDTVEDETVAVDMKAAFEQRWGNQWILNTDARVVLLSLMSESEKNQDLTTYGDYVLNADIDALKERLFDWGVQENQI